ncbi:MAG: hypothetical protein DWQ49_12545 [Bacteroidetes bacterium]|nr:MAG: hypothetical protein DWQ49_12545 [Bacteroidota bacterium]
MDNKRQLDSLIATHAAIIVGNGYTDIIVPQNKIETFTAGLEKLDIGVTDLTWWCYCKKDNNSGCPHGMGGPIYKDGYFSEITEEHDELDKMGSVELIQFIHGKETKGSLTFQNNDCLTPGFWLDVSESWKNNQN